MQILKKEKQQQIQDMEMYPMTSSSQTKNVENTPL